MRSLLSQSNVITSYSWLTIFFCFIIDDKLIVWKAVIAFKCSYGVGLRDVEFGNADEGVNMC